MRRPLALLAALIVLAAAPARAGEPYDVDLSKLGAPAASVWLQTLPCAATSTCTTQQQDDAAVMAADSRARFARLAADLYLASSTALLEPASTTGHSGFDVGLELAYTPVTSELLGTDTASFPGVAGARPTWPTRSEQPTGLMATSLHVRKAFPYSLEAGGRLTYLSKTSYFAAQLQGKWAFVEGFKAAPDVAILAAWTKVLGPSGLNLTGTELSLLASKRFGVSAVMSLTPYLALRYAMMNASTKALLFLPDPPATPLPPAELAAATAAFPSLHASFFRTTLGCRMTSGALSLALEATYFAGATMGKAGASDAQYPQVKAPSSVAAAFKFGFEF